MATTSSMTNVPNMLQVFSEACHNLKFCDPKPVFRPNFRSREGYCACETFLDAAATFADALRVPRCSRGYRKTFTKNYRALFPDPERHYRIDVLEAAVEGFSLIWVNGERYEFTSKVLKAAIDLSDAWSNTIEGCQDFLAHFESKKMPPSWLFEVPEEECVPLKDQLAELDIAWAAFEQNYIFELIDIEKHARRFLLEAVSCELAVQKLEDLDLKTTAEYYECEKSFVKQLCALNSVANCRRKGRDDFTNNLLVAAEHILKKTMGDNCSEDAHMYVVSSIANQVVQAYQSLRTFLRDLATVPEKIDPHLCNNSDLVDHLVVWEEAWDKGIKFLMDQNCLECLVKVVRYIASLGTHYSPFYKPPKNVLKGRLPFCLSAMHSIANFKEQIAEQDPAALLVVPRLVILMYLLDPYQRPSPFVLFLHHIFASSPRASRNPEDPIPSDLAPIVSRYETLCAECDGDDSFAESLVIARLLGGHGELITNYKSKEVSGLLDVLAREVEYWSVLIQRHNASEWNEFLQVVLQCLQHSPTISKPAPFLDPNLFGFRRSPRSNKSKSPRSPSDTSTRDSQSSPCTVDASPCTADESLSPPVSPFSETMPPALVEAASATSSRYNSPKNCGQSKPPTSMEQAMLHRYSVL
eukprot:Platyproteum_vivax@DN5800_c0_g1_i1.p1